MSTRSVHSLTHRPRMRARRRGRRSGGREREQEPWLRTARGNTIGTGRRRGPGRPWPKGVSGNPRGRPEFYGPIQELARQQTEAALETLVEIMQHGRNESARVAAAQAVLDRGWGRPVQALEHSGPEGSALLPADLTVLPDVQLAQLSALLEEIASAGPRRPGAPTDEPHPGATFRPRASRSPGSSIGAATSRTPGRGCASACGRLMNSTRVSPIKPFPVGVSAIGVFAVPRACSTAIACPGCGAAAGAARVPGDPRPAMAVGRRRRLLLVPKARRMKLTWLFCALHAWLACARAVGMSTRSWSRRRNKSPSSCSTAWKGSSRAARRDRYRPPAWTRQQDLLTLENGSRVWAVAEGADQLRQYTATAILADEFGTWAWPRAAFSAMRPCIEGGGRLTLLSSAYPGFWA